MKKNSKRQKNPAVKDHCQLNGNFRGLVHDKSNLSTGKKCFSCSNFCPVLFWIKLLSNFEKLFFIAIEKCIGIKGYYNLAKTSEKKYL